MSHGMSVFFSVISEKTSPWWQCHGCIRYPPGIQGTRAYLLQAKCNPRAAGHCLSKNLSLSMIPLYSRGSFLLWPVDLPRPICQRSPLRKYKTLVTDSFLFSALFLMVERGTSASRRCQTGDTAIVKVKRWNVEHSKVWLTHHKK